MDNPAKKARVLGCNVWLHRNVPGQRDQFLEQPPHCLELNGIAVFPKELGNYPRLPLLGREPSS